MDNDIQRREHDETGHRHGAKWRLHHPVDVPGFEQLQDLGGSSGEGLSSSLSRKWVAYFKGVRCVITQNDALNEIGNLDVVSD